MSELVTGEAVVLGLRPARLPSRGLAVLVDLAVAWGTYIAVSLVLVSTLSSMDSAALAAASVAAFVLVQVGIPIVIETLSHGRSLGKVICGLRVVREDGGPIRFRHALVRGAMGAIEIVLTMGVVASIASLVSARGRRVGDVFAGTLVVRERIPAEEAGAGLPAPAPWLAAEVSGLDLSRVPDQWWLTVRQFLGRMEQLDPQVGEAMAGRFAEDLRGLTGVRAPAGVHPVAYLAAVAGERQAREARRAFGASWAVSGGVGPTAPEAAVAPAGAVAPVPSGAAAVEPGAVGPGAVGPGAVDAGAGGRWALPGGIASGGGAPSVGAGGAGAGRAAETAAERQGGGGAAGGEARTGFAPPV
ncbi:RDD family protein [Streptomyces sp. NPDC053427]|uniref:RDD family protein n=1 Tax=Streptomyces sp. NPDC053427 TaxID=3365701 RepID=UPI0037D5245E